MYRHASKLACRYLFQRAPPVPIKLGLRPKPRRSALAILQTSPHALRYRLMAIINVMRGSNLHMSFNYVV